MNPFTATEQRIVDKLADGKPHHRNELIQCLPDDMGDRTNLNRHVTAIRRKLRPTGQGVICELRNRAIHYRHVRFISMSE